MSDEPKYLLVGRIDYMDQVIKEIVLPYSEVPKITNILDNSERTKVEEAPSGYWQRFYLEVFDSMGRSLEKVKVACGETCYRFYDKGQFFTFCKDAQAIDLEEMLEAYLVDAPEWRPEDPVEADYENMESQFDGQRGLAHFCDWRPGIDQRESQLQRRSFHIKDGKLKGPRGTVNHRVPSWFWVKMWKEVARVEAIEYVAKGYRRRRLVVGPDGTFVPVDPVEEYEKTPEGNLIVKSPLESVYEQSLVSEGDEVSNGQALYVIDADGIKIEVKSDLDGTVSRILVDDATPVKYDTVIMHIDPLKGAKLHQSMKS